MIEEPIRHYIGFLREERDKEDRGRTGQRPQERLDRLGNIMGEGEGAGKEQCGVEKMPDVQTCTGWTKV